jgi:hypothetical protein
MKFLTYILVFSGFAVVMLACNGSAGKKGKYLVIGDSSKIVTESDSQYLQNVVRDLAEVHGTQNTNSIDEVMKDVDSTQKSISLNKPSDIKPISGSTLTSGDISVLLAGSVVKSGSRYIFQTGAVEENMTCQVKDLDSCKLEQRSGCVLKVVINQKSTELASLGTHITDWQKLPGKNCTYISHSKVDMKFKEIAATQLAALTKPLIQKSGLPAAEQQKLIEQQKAASSTNSTMFETEPKWIELRVTGQRNGKNVSKIFRIDI